MTQELSSVHDATRVELDDVGSNINKLRADLRRLQDASDGSPCAKKKDIFQTLAPTFVSSAQEKITELDEALKMARDTYIEVSAFFGEKKDAKPNERAPAHEWLGFIDRFLQDFDKAVLAQRVRAERQERQARRKQERQKIMRRGRMSLPANFRNTPLIPGGEEENNGSAPPSAGEGSGTGVKEGARSGHRSCSSGPSGQQGQQSLASSQCTSPRLRRSPSPIAEQPRRRASSLPRGEARRGTSHSPRRSGGGSSGGAGSPVVGPSAQSARASSSAPRRRCGSEPPMSRPRASSVSPRRGRDDSSLQVDLAACLVRAEPVRWAPVRRPSAAILFGLT